MAQAGWGWGRSARTLTRVCKFQETPNKHCEETAVCMPQAQKALKSSQSLDTGTLGSSFWAQFHLLLLLSSSRARKGCAHGRDFRTRDTGLGPSLLCHTGLPALSSSLCLEEPGHGGTPGVFRTESNKSISVKTLRGWWVTTATYISCQEQNQLLGLSLG